MSNKEALEAELKELRKTLSEYEKDYRAKIDPLVKRINEVEDLLAVENCPYEVGQVLTNGRYRVVVVKIQKGTYFSYSIIGRNIKKNGFLGSFTQINYWRRNDWYPADDQTKPEGWDRDE